MGRVLIGIAFYLASCASIGKIIEGKPLSTRRLIAVIESVIAACLIGLMGDFNPIVVVGGAVVCFIGYLAMVNRPAWIVGEKY